MDDRRFTKTEYEAKETVNIKVDIEDSAIISFFVSENEHSINRTINSFVCLICLPINKINLY